MRISGRGTCNATNKSGMNSLRQTGFTLVEILVVLVIIGITVGLVSINFMPDDRRTLLTEAQKLTLLLEQAHDEAIISGKDIAWSVEGDTYRFWHRNEQGQWAQTSGDELFRERPLAPEVQLAELQINLVKTATNERLIFSPGGLNAPFSINLVLHERHVLIKGDSAGKITLVADEQE